MEFISIPFFLLVRTYLNFIVFTSKYFKPLQILTFLLDIKLTILCRVFLIVEIPINTQFLYVSYVSYRSVLTLSIKINPLHWGKNSQKTFVFLLLNFFPKGKILLKTQKYQNVLIASTRLTVICIILRFLTFFTFISSFIWCV